MTEPLTREPVKRFLFPQVNDAEDGLKPTYVLATDYDILRARLEAMTKKYQGLVKFYDDHNGTPCEQIRHQQEVEQLRARLEAVTQEKDELEELAFFLIPNADTPVTWKEECERVQQQLAAAQEEVGRLRELCLKTVAVLQVYVHGGNPNSPYQDGKHPFYVMGSHEVLEALKQQAQQGGEK